MTVDLLAAALRPEATLFGSHASRPQDAVESEPPGAADAAIRAENLLIAMLRRLRPQRDGRPAREN